MRKISEKDTERLRQAKLLLESPSFLITLSDKVGRPIDWAVRALPDGAQKIVQKATRKTLKGSLDVVVASFGDSQAFCAYTEKIQGRFMHKALVCLTGGIGGAVGIMALPIELPLSTSIMLRSIADIARQYGEDLTKAESKLECLSVFALGGKSTRDDAAENTYFTVRYALGRALTEAAEFIVERGMVEEGAPVLVRFVLAISARFEIAVTEKLAAELIPALGALGGAGINLAFTNHFQKMAMGHFAVRFLERKYNKKLVERTYKGLKI